MNTESIEQIIASQEKPFSGVVYVRQKGEIIHAKGYGMAHRASSTPNTVDTRFAIASGTKTFTAVAVCQLIEQGKFDFDTPISECIDAKLPTYDPTVTVKHLLTHSSGIPDYLDEETMTDADYEALYAKYPVYTMKSPADYLRMFPEGKMHFTPGTSFRYCNGGYILLALLVEQQSGLPYQQYVEEYVFAKAGMTDSGFFSMDNLPERTAYGYLDDGRTNIFSVPIIGGGDGGAFVTAPDMATFWDALYGHKLLKPQTTAEMLKPQVLAGKPEENKHYGYGVWITKLENGDILRHSAIGGDAGVNFTSANFPQPQHDTLITIIGNAEGPAWDVFWKLFGELVDG